MSQSNLALISLCSGALGLDVGMERAGFDVRVALEPNSFAVATIRRNRPLIPVLQEKLEDVSTDELLRAAGLKRREPVLITAGLCCQSFSTAGQRGSVTDPRGALFAEFIRVVEEARPRFFLVENVRGILSSAIEHRPLNKRGPGYPPLRPEEELGSGFRSILQRFSDLGYYTVFDLVNTADFGVPQTRERLVFLGSRDGEPVEMPVRTHAAEPVNGLPRWVDLRECIGDLVASEQKYRPFCPSKARYIKFVPAGGNWHDIPKELQPKAMGAAYKSWGGRVGFFRRLSWDRPAPTLPTRPDSKATMLCHPSELRPLSVQEYARIQQFPDDWEFVGGLPQQYKQIGNAVPVGMAEALGRAIVAAMDKPGRRRRGIVVCPNKDLLGRLAKRPSTILNPSRMRRVKGHEAAKRWLDRGKMVSRRELLSIVSEE